MDLDGVRTFLLVIELGQLQDAAPELGITQQAASKRLRSLERGLGVSLFTRTPRGLRLTVDGQAFGPHARELVLAADRAARSVGFVDRALRVDVTNRRIAPAVAVEDFHRSNPDLELDIVTLPAGRLEDAMDAVRARSLDASFRAVTTPKETMPAGLSTARAVDHELEVLVGPRHPLAQESSLSPRRLAGHRLWVPGIVAGTEWARFYEDLGAAFELSIDNLGPHFGDEALLDQLSTSRDLATIIGRRDRYLWPAHYDLRRIPLRDPTPIYPHSLIWRTGNLHPGLSALRAHLAGARRAHATPIDIWEPIWGAVDTDTLDPRTDSTATDPPR